MIQDFIESNELKSKIIKINSNLSTNRAIINKELPPKRTVKLQLFSSKEPIITIIPFQKEINIEKLKEIEKVDELIEMDEIETLEMTGYKKNFLPPISIYGIKIIIDESLKNKDVLYSRIGEDKILETPLVEIIETNDETIFEKIIM